MIGYITVGSNDLQAAAAFYDALLAEIGGQRMMEEDSFIAWSSEGPGAAFSVTKPFDGNAATVGNGVMAAIAVGLPQLNPRLASSGICANSSGL